MYTIQQNKIALSPFDDKRYIVTCRMCKNGSCADCNFKTMAHGHYKIPQQQGSNIESGAGTSNADDEIVVNRKRINTIENIVDDQPKQKRLKTETNIDSSIV